MIIITALGGSVYQEWRVTIVLVTSSRGDVEYAPQEAGLLFLIILLKKVIGWMMWYAYCAGGPFELVSCPHYTAEIVVYVGLALLLYKQMGLVYPILCWIVSWRMCTCTC